MLKELPTMMPPSIKRMAQTAGFSESEVSAMASKLALFALLIQEERNSQLMAMFRAFGQSELRACAQACRSAGHDAAADLLLAHADAWDVSADAITLQQLRQRLPAP